MECEKSVPPGGDGHVAFGPRRGAVVDAAVVLGVLLLGVGIAVPTVANMRETARRALCAKNAMRIVTSQNAWATAENKKGRREQYLLGTEADTLTAGKRPATAADASRAFVLMFKKRFFERLSDLACPSDPFVAPLSLDPERIDREFVDLHGPAEPATEKVSDLLPVWAEETAASRFSLSMQTGSTQGKAHPAPKMDHRIPVVGERNPWCESFAGLTGGESPTDASEAGNPWNHNRGGGTLAYLDGRAEFRTALDDFELPATAGTGVEAGATVSVYSGDASRSGRCLTPGRFGTVDRFTVWLVD